MVFLKRLVLIIDEFIEGELKMKLTTKKLRQIIREEVANTVKEAGAGYSQITRKQREAEHTAGVNDVYGKHRPSPDEKVQWMIKKLKLAWKGLATEALATEALAHALKTGENLNHQTHAWRDSILTAANNDQKIVDQIVDASME